MASVAMAQGVRSPNEEAVDTWSSLFVKGVTSTRQSAKFVKQLVVVSLSAVTYLRAFFPETAYREQIINTHHHKILTPSPLAPDASLFVHQLFGCFDAIDKKYVSAAAVVHSTGLNFVSSDGVGRRVRYPTMQLLSTLGNFLHQPVIRSSSNLLLGFKLKYYDEVTPADYDPPGFIPVTETEPIFPLHVVKIKVGKVSTGFHKVRLDVITAALDKHDNNNTPAVSSCHISNQGATHSGVHLQVPTNTTTTTTPPPPTTFPTTHPVQLLSLQVHSSVVSYRTTTPTHPVRTSSWHRVPWTVLSSHTKP
ncbi:hypothetical protein Pcinc_025017 [Petrolisthes cinctipes]|uniref:HORMA domain-containing protein n=1 Tax=Petrolisthes cinctipes TaxID=88211 RepID=A0AAE1KDM0_PETCI|nr:hypothetical protein Pcinc_025017 [Petrolisthes cinctipes]